VRKKEMGEDTRMSGEMVERVFVAQPYSTKTSRTYAALSHAVIPSIQSMIVLGLSFMLGFLQIGPNGATGIPPLIRRGVRGCAWA
jgi:hypothetical protein